MPDPFVIPTDVASWSDEYWVDVIEHLKDTGVIPEDHEVGSLSITVDSEGGVKVTRLYSTTTLNEFE